MPAAPSLGTVILMSIRYLVLRYIEAESPDRQWQVDGDASLNYGSEG